VTLPSPSWYRAVLYHATNLVISASRAAGDEVPEARL
jgi:hypothetical protein